MEPQDNDAAILVQRLVRTYTDELEVKQPEGHDSNATGRAPIVDKDRQACSQELDFWFRQLNLEKNSSSRELGSLKDHATKLLDAWQVFHRRLPAEEQGELNNHNPDWEDIRKVIKRVQASWIAKNDGTYGKATARLRKVLDGLHSHRTFLRILPESNNYASVFCGSLQVLIQASATHRKVAEGLSRAILEINDIVRACSIDMQLFAGNDQVEIAATLYCRIFEFLEKAMLWYTKSRAKRFINSFKEDAYEEFESDVIEIRRLSSNIMRRAQQSMHIENRTTNLMVQETRLESRATKQDIQEIKQILSCFQQNLIQKMDKDGKTFCLGHAKAYCAEMLIGCAQELKEPNDPKLEIKEARGSRDPEISKASLTELSHSFCRYWEACESLIPPESIKKILVEAAAAAALRDWRLGNNSGFLCVSGPWQTAAPSPAYQLAAAICSFAIQAKIPIIHFSCTPSVEDNGKSEEKESEVLVHLVYSLITQLVEILPEGFQSDEEIPIAHLDGTTKTFASALLTLQLLLDASPSPLFCIIDNLQYLEDPATENEHLIRFLNVLRAYRESCTIASPARSFKVLFTTSGRSTALVEVLEPYEMVLANNLIPTHSTKRSRPSQSLMVPVTPDFF